MTTTDKEPLLFSRVTYGSMIVSAVGLLATVAYGMGDPMLRTFAEVLLGWMMIAIAAFWARFTAGSWTEMDTKIAQIKSSAQQQ